MFWTTLMFSKISESQSKPLVRLNTVATGNRRRPTLQKDLPDLASCPNSA